MGTQSTANHLDVIKSITCRVETPNASGTGFFVPTPNKNIFYFITAKHCLLGKGFDGELKNESVTLFMPALGSDGFIAIALDHNAEILLPGNTVLDIAIIVLTSRDLNIPDIPLLDVRYFQQDCSFCGYPGSYQSQVAINVPAYFVDNNVISTTTPLETYDSVSHDNCEGFSGSGVFGVIDNNPFFVGMLYELKEPFRRFNVYNLSQINSVLAEHDVLQLPATTLPLNVSLQQSLEKLERSSSRVLETINGTFDEQLSLPRESIQSRFDEVFRANHLVILKGIAGAGKSAYAKSQLNVLQEKGYKVLAFKADWFAKKRVEEIFPTINYDLQDLLSSLGTTQQLIILIDSLEKLLEVDTYFALKEFLQICKRLPYVKLVITCRNYAYQQLIFDLHYDFPSYSVVDVPLLSSRELNKVSEHFPALKSILDNPQFRKILKRPFYLNLAIRHREIFQQDIKITELKFRELIWSHVVTRSSHARADTFAQIAIERASQMTLFVHLEGLDATSVQGLVHDGILEADDRIGNSYRPTHDIYEDIALIRFVDQAFQVKRNAEDFFSGIGEKAPAKRRGFRLWLNDVLTEPQHIVTFIHDVFESKTIARFWVDEVIIAILRSDFCHTFFQHSEQLLLENGHALLLRFIHLLRTTCQEPDEELIQAVQSQNDESLYQWIYLKPVGMGWEALIKFIDEHFDVLLPHRPLILRLLAHDWSKKVRHEFNIPVESRSAGTILCKILDDAKEHYGSWKNELYSKEEIDKGIEVLFQLSREFETEVRKLVGDANTSKKQFDKRFRHRERLFRRSLDLGNEVEEDDNEDKNYHLRNFYNEIIEFVLSGVGNRAVCSIMPDLVCKVAKEQWLTDEVESNTSYDSFLEEGIAFGLSNSTGNYFPPGIYKTPVRFLLYSRPEYALKLIVEIFDHCTEAYSNSKRGQRSNIVKVGLVQSDGTHTFQKGNAPLWGVFRGNIEATHYLLESILMSLESWFFELCQSDVDWADKWLKTSYLYLLKNSTSVAVTAVLASVAQAYPHKIRELCFPILKVREFYTWDIDRLVGESMSMAPIDIKIPFAQEERIKSNELPHRMYHLEYLVTKLQWEGYFVEISEIIDDLVKKCHKDDMEWKLALNRMDARKFVVDKTIEPPEENQIILRPVIDAELTDFVEEHARDTELQSRLMVINNWARSLYEGKAGVNTSIEQWRNAFNTYQELKEIVDDSPGLFRDPTHLAATGIKYFKDEITEEQLLWCIEIIVEAIMERVIGNIHRAPYSKFHIKTAIEIIPEVLMLDTDDEIQLDVKQVIFFALLHLATNESEYPFEAFRNSIWKIDPGYANACVAGLVEHSRLFKQRKWFQSDSKEAQQEREAFLHQETALAEQVAKNEIAIDLTDLSLSTHSIYYLTHAVLIIPFDTKHSDHLKFLSRIFQLHINQSKKKRQRNYHEDLGYRTRLELIRYIAQFVLSQNEQVAKTFFASVLDTVLIPRDNITHDSVKYVEDILEWIIIEQDYLQAESFWKLWEILEDRIRKSDRKYFIPYLLLSYDWNSKTNSWKPLRHKSFVMRRPIIEFGKYDLKSVVKLLSGIGMEALMPHGLNWLRNVFEGIENPKQELSDSNVFFYSEKLIQRTYYKYFREIKRDRELQQSLLMFLDLLIDAGSSLAFIVRERLITI